MILVIGDDWVVVAIVEKDGDWNMVEVVSDGWAVVTEGIVDAVAISDDDWVMVGIVDDGKVVGISNSLVVKKG